MEALGGKDVFAVRSCFDAACAAGNIDIVKMLEMEPMNYPSKPCFSPLAAAVKFNHLDALVHCGKQGYVDMIKFILDDPMIFGFESTIEQPDQIRLMVMKKVLNGAFQQGNMTVAELIELEVKSRMPTVPLYSIVEIDGFFSPIKYRDNVIEFLNLMVRWCESSPVPSNATATILQCLEYTDSKELAEWLFNHSEPHDINIILAKYVVKGYLEIVKWLDETLHISTHPDHVWVAVCGNSIEMLRYLVETKEFPLHNDEDNDDQYDFNNIQVDILEYLMDHEELTVDNVNGIGDIEEIYNPIPDRRRIDIIKRIGFLNQYPDEAIGAIIFHGNLDDLEEYKQQMFERDGSLISLNPNMLETAIRVFKYLLQVRKSQSNGINDIGIQVYQDTLALEDSIHLEVLYDHDPEHFQKIRKDILKAAASLSTSQTFAFLHKVYSPLDQSLDVIPHLMACFKRGLLSTFVYLSETYQIDLNYISTFNNLRLADPMYPLQGYIKSKLSSFRK
eukprot:gene2544-2915_t